MPNMVSPTRPSLQILGKTQEGVFSNFRFLVNPLQKKNCHNSRTSDDIDMKLGPVTKLDKRNKTTSKKFVDDDMSEDCEVIVIFPIYCQFGAIRKPDSRHMSVKLKFSLIVTFSLTKTENRTKKSLRQLSHYCFEYKCYFCQKCLVFAKKNADIAKLRGPWY